MDRILRLGSGLGAGIGAVSIALVLQVIVRTLNYCLDGGQWPRKKRKPIEVRKCDEPLCPQY